MEEAGPGGPYMVFQEMEELLDKLKLLHYEESYCRQLGFKALSRYKKVFIIISIDILSLRELFTYLMKINFLIIIYFHL